MEWQEADELGDSDDDSDDESMPPSSSSFKVWQRMVPLVCLKNSDSLTRRVNHCGHLYKVLYNM